MRSGIVCADDTRDENEASECEHTGDAELLLHGHLQFEDHGYWETDDDDVCADVEEDCEPVVDVGGFCRARFAFVCRPFSIDGIALENYVEDNYDP